MLGNRTWIYELLWGSGLLIQEYAGNVQIEIDFKGS